MTTPEPPASVKDWGLSWIRTGVPILWGYFLTFVAARLPDVHELLTANPYLPGLVTGLVALLWYGVMRKVEHRLPAWLTRFVLGANTAPQYVEGTLIQGEAVEFDDPPPPAAPRLA